MGAKITELLNKAKGFASSLPERFAKAREYAQANPRALQIAVVAVAALIVVGYGTFTFTSQPGFCKNCHEMEPAYNNWAKSVHAEVNCALCHVKPGLFNQLIHKVEAVKEVYYHVTVFSKPNPPTIYAKVFAPINAACEQCHSTKRILSFSGDLIVPHELHKQKGLTCPTCHTRLVHGEKDQQKPKMELCLTCHDGKKATSQCTKCHKKKNVPAEHKAANWMQVHGQEAGKSYLYCKKCHDWRPDWCNECHKQKPKSHQVLWRSNHGTNANANRVGCNACHKADYCMKCHGIQP